MSARAWSPRGVREAAVLTSAAPVALDAMERARLRQQQVLKHQQLEYAEIARLRAGTPGSLPPPKSPRSRRATPVTQPAASVASTPAHPKCAPPPGQPRASGLRIGSARPTLSGMKRGDGLCIRRPPSPQYLGLVHAQREGLASLALMLRQARISESEYLNA